MVLGVSPFELGFDVAAGAVVVGFAVAVIVTWRRLRRRLRRLRSSAAARGAMALYDAARTPGGLRGNAGPARLRVELWHSVSAATRAVRTAGESGAALGDLPSLIRRLHQAAEDLDRLLSISGGLRSGAPEVVELRAQVGETLRASEAIRLAALASGGDLTALRVNQLAADAEREVRSVTAGVAQARSALSGG